MSIDAFQEKIRKLKNPSVIDLTAYPEDIPAHIMQQEESLSKAYGRFCKELIAALAPAVPAVRVSWTAFSLLGPDGLTQLASVLDAAKDAGFYTILDAPEICTYHDAQLAAQTLFGEDSAWHCDALIVNPFIGSDAVKPFLPACKAGDKALFVLTRTPNKTAAELQDLLSGSRLVHMALADIVNRLGETIFGKCGYSRIGAVAGAPSADSIRSLRAKYKRMFLLVDGLDAPNGNAKNTSFAFDQFGRGAAAVSGRSVTAAWKEAESDGTDYTVHAVAAAERMKKNLSRYLVIL